MLRLSTPQRALLADKLCDVANVAAGALVFGQFLAQGGVSLIQMAAGIALWLVLTGWALALRRNE